MEYKTIKTYTYQSDILSIAPLLENEEIRHEFKDSNTVLTDPLISNSIGGIKLLVHPEDVENAILVLAKHKYGVINYSDEELITKYMNYLQEDQEIENLNNKQFLYIAIIIAILAIVTAVILLLLN